MNAHRVWRGKPEGKDHLEDIAGTITLKSILEK
jgi:hypothetical protein